jgi:hypothetical protein
MTNSNTRKIGKIKIQSMNFDVFDFGDDRLEYTVYVDAEDDSDRYVIHIDCITEDKDDSVTFTVDSSGGLEYEGAMALAGSDIANFVYYTLFVKHIRL